MNGVSYEVYMHGLYYELQVAHDLGCFHVQFEIDKEPSSPCFCLKVGLTCLKTETAGM